MNKETKTVFTKEEALKIRKILQEMEGNRTKQNRAKLRRIGFKISAFNQFTVRNFDHLIEDEIITIRD